MGRVPSRTSEQLEEGSVVSLRAAATQCETMDLRILSGKVAIKSDRGVSLSIVVVEARD
jgi:hypothetical protein